MKFFHYHADTISRSTGRSCVQAVAYATRVVLFEERRGITANYKNVKDHDVFWETLSPEGSGIEKNDLSIWNQADREEDEILSRRHKDPDVLRRKIASTRTAYNDEFSLPKELTQEQNIELAREYVQKMFVQKGLVATYAIHWEEGNPHVHIVYSARRYENGRFSDSKSLTRGLRGPGGVRWLREVAAHIINKHQEMAGLEDHVDPRSYDDRRLGIIPTQHKGYKAHQRERDGQSSRIVETNQEISEENKERILREPEIIIKELSSTQATFSEKDIIRLMQKRLQDDIGILGDHILHTVLEKVVVVGTGMDNQKRYTTQEYADMEARILESFDRYKEGKAGIKIDSGQVEKMIQTLQETGKETGFVPNEAQLNGIRTLCGDSQFYVMIGRAGTGKTTTLKPVVQLHQEAGYQVIGMAPSAVAASQLEADTGCPSDTIAHYAYYWKKHEEAVELLARSETEEQIEAAQRLVDKYSPWLLTDKTLVIIDEAGMVGVGDAKGAIPGGWDAITKALDRSGAKLIGTGDNHQYKPIDRGDILRRLVYTLTDSKLLCQLTDIVRQKIPWMREASHHLAEQNISTALGIYENHGHIQGYASDRDVYQEIARQYLRNKVREPDSQGIVIVATNEERLAINRKVRSILKGNGFLPHQDVFWREEEGYCVGDRIVFTQNDRGHNTEFEAAEKGFFVQNSMQAVIQSITPVQWKDAETGEITETYEIVAVVPDTQSPTPSNKATIRFTLEDFKEFTHAYAVTGFKSQAKTLDWVLVKASRVMDAHGLYVCLTRHLWEVMLYYSQEDFANYQALVNSLGKVSVKDLVVDYSISEDNQEYWQDVQEYKDTGRELQSIRIVANSLRDTGPDSREEVDRIWKDYRIAEDDRKSLANLVLRDWEVYKDFVRQAGLTRESLEIAAGLKKRSLSRSEQEAQVTVEQYVCVALEARQLWRDIRRTHPGSLAKTHPDWKKFEEARQQRGILANQICLRPVLHKPFLKEAAEGLAKADIGYVTKDNKVSYSMATIKAQAEAYQSKILQERLLKDDANPDQKRLLETLVAYVEARDMAGSIWKDLKGKTKGIKDTLLQNSFSKEMDEFFDLRKKRDFWAMTIMGSPEAFGELAEKVGIRLDLEGKITEQALQGRRDELLATYQNAPEEMARLEAAYDLTVMMKAEANLEKRRTVPALYEVGLKPQEISTAAFEYQKRKVFEGLKTEPERALFSLLDAYGNQCREANALYAQCANDVKEKQALAQSTPDSKTDTEKASLGPWNSVHYEGYKAACDKRNETALHLFDQRDYGEVIAMAEAMGIRFKDVELSEIFARCEQAERSRRIAAYREAETLERKGEAAVALRQMIRLEKKQPDVVSPTARQVFYAGIDFKELQTVAFNYGRACVLKNLGSEQEVDIYQALEAYENAFRPANHVYKECLDESTAKSKPDNEVKPWETDKFKEYLPLVAIQDEKAHHLLKSFEFGSVAKVAQQMGISLKRLDVEAHRHSLRQTLQTYLDGEKTIVPIAAQEVMNWLEFDNHSNHKHTFKILREKDLWPKEIFESVQDFIDKKRQWRNEEKRNLKEEGRAAPTKGNQNPYQVITWERSLNKREIEDKLRDRIYELATTILGNPIAGNPKSRFCEFKKDQKVSVGINGVKIGVFTNFVTGVKGGPIKLIEDQMGLTYVDAKQWALDWLGDNAQVIEYRVVETPKTSKKAEKSDWKPILPVPQYARDPVIVGNKYLDHWIRNEGFKLTGQYLYRDKEGNRLGFVCRFERPHPKKPGEKEKKTPVLSFCQNEKGDRYWRWVGFFGEGQERTPYGVEKLAKDLTKPVLVVEGEKKADVAQKMLPGHHVLSWIGGAGQVGKTNWEYLAGKEVVIWPDNDNPGFQAADTFQKIVRSLNTEKGLQGTVGIVSLPKGLPEKWDLANNLPEGWTIQTVERMIKEAVPSKEKAFDNSLVQKSHELAQDVQKDKDTQGSLQQSVQKFITLSETHDKLIWSDPQFKVIDAQIKEIARQCLDNENFIQAVQASQNTSALQRLDFEIIKKKQAERTKPEYEMEEHEWER